MSSLDALRAELAEEARARRAPTLGGDAQLAREVPGLSAVASTARGAFAVATDSVLLRHAEVGDRAGLLLAVSLGNEKDAGSAVAVGAAVATLARAFAAPLLSVADVVPRLRAALLESHERVFALADAPIDQPELRPTFFGPREQLHGIGAACMAALALADTLWIGHVGDGCALLVRDAHAKQLTVPHTLAHETGVPKAPLGLDPAHVVLRVLGSRGGDRHDVTRLASRPGDRVVLGGMALRTVWERGGLAALDPELEAARAQLADAMAHHHPGAPPTIAVVDVRG